MKRSESDWLTCNDPKPMLMFLRGKASGRKLRLFACACSWRVAGFFKGELEEIYDSVNQQPSIGRPSDLITLFGEYSDSVVASMTVERMLLMAERYADEVIMTPYEVADLIESGRVAERDAGGILTTLQLAKIGALARSALEYACNYERAYDNESPAFSPIPADVEGPIPMAAALVGCLEADALDGALKAAFSAAEVRGVHDAPAKSPPVSVLWGKKWHHTEREQATTAEKVLQANLLRDIFGNPYRSVSFDPAWVACGNGAVSAISRTIYSERRFDLIPNLADALIVAGCMNDEILNHCRSKGPHVRGCWVVDRVLGKN